MQCSRCKSEKVIQVSAKCSDMCVVRMGEHEHEGYVPSGIGIGGGDYIELKLCIGCGQVQGSFPKEFPEASGDVA